MTGQEYKPSTEQVRSHYVFNQSNRWRAERGASFDLWLTEVERQAKAEALTEAAEDVDARWDETGLGAVGSSWLRARAAEYRKEQDNE